MKLVSLEDYILDKSLLSIKETDFTKIVALLTPFENESSDVDTIQELSNEEFMHQFESLRMPMYSMVFQQGFQGFQTPLTELLIKTLFRSSTLSEVEHHLQFNVRLDGTNLSKVYLTLDEDAYSAKKAESEATMETLKTKFLNDLFDDSGLEDNAHNRLILDKAWMVASNVDYYDHYMSVNFYLTVERWFNTLKDLSISGKNNN